MFKKFVILIIILANLIALSACYVDIDQQLMVSGIAIDEGQNGKKFHITAETISPTSKEVETKLIEVDGNTIFQALRDSISISSKKLYIGHCKVIFVSEKLAKKGVGEILDFIVRDHEARIETDVIITKGSKAKDALTVEKLFSPIVSFRVDELFDTKENGVGTAPTIRMYEIYDEIYDNGTAAAIPAVEVVKIDDKKELKFYGTGVFNKDKLKGYLNEDETRNLSILRNKFKTGLLTFTEGDNKNLFASYEVFGSKCKRKLEFDSENKVKVNITIKTKVGIGETDSETDFQKSEEVEKTGRDFESKMENDLYKLISKSQSELGCDILGIGKQIFENQPKVWETYKENWDETYKAIDFNVDCNAKIIGSGTYKKGTLRNSG